MMMMRIHAVRRTFRGLQVSSAAKASIPRGEGTESLGHSKYVEKLGGFTAAD